MYFIDKIPFNGYKSGILFALLVIVHGLGAMDALDPEMVMSLVKWLELAFAGAVVHKVSKIKAS